MSIPINPYTPIESEGNQQGWTCRPWAGLWNALKIRLFRSDETVVATVIQKLTDKTIGPETVRWLSTKQLDLLKAKPLPEGASEIFKKAVYLDFKKNHNVPKREALIAVYIKAISQPIPAPSSTDTSRTITATGKKLGIPITDAPLTETKTSLQNINSKLNDRALGTYVLTTSSDGSRCHLQILGKAGTIEQLDFTYDKTTQKLSRGNKEYDLGTLLEQLAQEQREQALLQTTNRALFTDREVNGKIFRKISVVKEGRVITEEIQMGNDFTAHFTKAKQMCGHDVTSLEDPEIEKSTWVRLHSIESRNKQLETREHLNALIVDTKIDTSVFERFAIDRPEQTGPFLVLPGTKGGDFTIVAHLLTDNRFAWNSPITVLEDGKIQHDGRTFDNFDDLRSKWHLGAPFYDAFAASESSCKSKTEAENALKSCSEDCFLLWSDTKSLYVSIRQGTSIKTNPLTKDATGHFHIGGEKINGELIGELRNRYKQPYGDLQAYKPLKQFLDVGAKADISTRVAALKYQKVTGTGFTLTRDINKPRTLIVTEFTPGGWFSSAATTTYSVTLLADGKVRKDNTIYDSFDDIRGNKQSIKQLEEQDHDSATRQAAIEKAISQLPLTDKSPKDAKKEVQEYSQVLGDLAINGYLLSRRPGTNTLCIIYRAIDGSVKEQEITVTNPDDQTVATQIASLKPLSTLHELKTARDSFLEKVKRCNLYAKSDATKALKKYAPVLAPLTGEIPYILSSEKDAKGTEQFFLSYVNDTQEVVHIPLDTSSEAAIRALGAESNVEAYLCKESKVTGLDKSYKLREAEIEARYEIFQKRSKEITENPSFLKTSMSGAEALKGLGLSQKELQGAYVIRANAPPTSLINQLKSWISWETPLYDKFIITVSKDGNTIGDHNIEIDHKTGKFVFSGKSYNSLEQLLQALGATKPYADLVPKKDTKPAYTGDIDVTQEIGGLNGDTPEARLNDLVTRNKTKEHLALDQPFNKAISQKLLKKILDKESFTTDDLCQAYNALTTNKDLFAKMAIEVDPAFGKKAHIALSKYESIVVYTFTGTPKQNFERLESQVDPFDVEKLSKEQAESLVDAVLNEKKMPTKITNKNFNALVEKTK